MKPTTPASAAASPETSPAATPSTAAAPTDESKQTKTEKPDAPKFGTTKRLFSDWVQDSKGRAVPRTSLPEGAKVSDEPPAPAGKDPEKAPPSPAPVKDELIDPAAIQGKKLKLVVDGKEEIVAVEDVLKGVQLEKHLTQKGQSLDQREHQLNEREKAVRLQLEALANPGTKTPNNKEDPAKESLFADDPLVQKLLKDNEAMSKQLQDLSKLTARQRYEENLKLLAADVKKATGYEDFLDYKPQIEKVFSALSPEERLRADSPEWWANQFLVLKTKSLQEALLKAKNQPTPPARPESGVIDGIADPKGGPAGAKSDQAWQERHDAAFAKAKASGATEDWLEVLRIKREGAQS